MRIFLIVAGISFQIFVVISGLLIFISWIALPFIIIAGFIFIFIY